MSKDTESQLLSARREKIQQIRERGINPYPNDFKRKNLIGQVIADMRDLSPEQVEGSGKSYVLAGRIIGRNHRWMAVPYSKSSSGV